MDASSPAALDKAALDQLFFEARTHYAFQPRPVEPELLHRLHDLLRWGPTAANSCPLRLVFVASAEAKAKLLPCMSAGNVKKVQSAPVTAILAMDLRFFDKLAKLFPHTDAKSWYEGKEALITETAMRNSSLQGGYFILAARALGLDCGPMSGFDATKVREAFLAGTSWTPNFLCNLGYGDRSALHARQPRLDFDETSRIV